MEDHARRAVNPGEANITARLTFLMIPRFLGWNVDAEYDRDHVLEKMLYYGFDKEVERLRRIRPDIIVHTINTSDNILVVEAKRKENPDRAKDVAKLRGMTAPDGKYAYLVGVRLVTDLVAGNVPECEVFVDGETDEGLTSVLARLLPTPRGSG